MPAGKMKLVYKGSLSKNRKQDKEINKLKKTVKKLVKADEKKYLDNAILQYPSTTVQKWPLNTLVVWAGNNDQRHYEREGQSIVMTSLRMRGLVEIVTNAASPDDNNRIRMLIVYSPDSSTPVQLSDILQSPTQIDSHYRIKPPEPYKIMFDKTFNLQNVIQRRNNPDYQNATSTEKFRIPFKVDLGQKAFGKSGIKADWIVGAANVAPSRGALTLMTFSDSSVISHPQLSAQSRLRFLDN